MPEVKIPYVERDVSWMYFNHRILQEAEKEYVPLLENQKESQGHQPAK